MAVHHSTSQALYRSIQEMDGFSDQLREIIPSAEDSDEILKAVTFAASREPTMAGILVLDNVWAMEVQASAKSPRFVVLYTFDTTHIYLHSAIRLPPDEDEDEGG